MKKSIFSLLLLSSCTSMDKSISDEEAVKNAVIDNYNFINNQNLSDRKVFDEFKMFYSENFVLVPTAGEPLSNKEVILEEWRSLFKENKGHFKLVIDRVDVSGDLAYVIYHYDEKLTNIKTGDIYFEVVQTAIAVLKKNSKGKWLFEVLRWN